MRKISNILTMKKIHLMALSAIVLSLPLLGGTVDSFLPQEEYNQALSAFQQKNWDDVKSHGKKVIGDFPESPFLSDLYYYIGVAYFNQKDYDLANHYFSEFLGKYATPNFFEEAIIYKYRIAVQFQKGAGKHIMGYERMPKWQSGWEDAYKIYNEVISTLPRHEVAAKALFNKAEMLRIDENYKEALNCYETIIRRFPKHPLCPDSYVEIANNLFAQSKQSFPDRDFVEQSDLNFKKFAAEFPNESRLTEVKGLLIEMQDRCAKDLWESALYYEKKKKTPSCVLYYNSIVQKYPESKYAQLATNRLSDLKERAPKEGALSVNEFVSVQ